MMRARSPSAGSAGAPGTAWRHGYEHERHVQLARPDDPRRGIGSSGSPSTMLGSTSGWRVLKVATARGTPVAPALGNVPIAPPAAQLAAIAASSCSASPSQARMASAWATRARRGVGQPHPAAAALQQPGVAPASRSRAATCWLTADWVVDSDSAAAENEPRSRDLAQHPHAAHVEHKWNLSDMTLLVICAHGPRAAMLTLMSGRAWAMMGFLAAMWGSSYLFIEIGLDDLSPAGVVFARTALGALVLLPFAIRRGALSGLRGRVGALFVLAAVQIAGPFLLISAGQQEISSSLAGILVASAPIFTALIALRVSPAERSSRLGAVGVGVGIVGVAVLLGIDVGGDAGALVGGLMVLAWTLATRSAPTTSSAAWPATSRSGSSPARWPRPRCSRCRQGGRRSTVQIAASARSRWGRWPRSASAARASPSSSSTR